MEYLANTDIGRKREKNEDSYFAKKYDENTALYIVADGLGGYAGGEVASGIAVNIISKYFEQEYIVNKNLNIPSVIKNGIIIANDEIFKLEKTDEKYKSMGTTIVVLCVVNENIYYASVGDSRLYSMDINFLDIVQETEDDTYVNTLLKTNSITYDEAQNHTQKHVLTKAIGIFSNLDVEIKETKINAQEKNIYLLCTDGVTNMLKDNEILEIFRKNKFHNTAERIIQKSNENGGIDNATVVIVKF